MKTDEQFAKAQETYLTSILIEAAKDQKPVDQVVAEHVEWYKDMEFDDEGSLIKTAKI